MRKLSAFVALAAVLLCGCSKHNNTGNSYYFSFQSGAIQYSTVIDSLVGVEISANSLDGTLSMGGFRNQSLTDSAAAGVITLATWQFYLINLIPEDSVFIGDYTTDSSAANLRQITTYEDSRFRFYTTSDPHQGQYVLTNDLPFTISITHWGSGWFAGTFYGQVVQFNPTTNVSDTATITNGKFKLPIP